MKEKPIIFSGEMVRAILDGRKTQTRRIVKPQPVFVASPSIPFKTNDADPKGIIICPHGRPGDRLWVREGFTSMNGHVFYKADALEGREKILKYKPSIHMPRWASRISLEIVSVRVERLHEITNEDCFLEGLPSDTTKCNKTWFGDLWESLNGHGSWDANPWVWVLIFKRIFCEK